MEPTAPDDGEGAAGKGDAVADPGYVDHDGPSMVPAPHSQSSSSSGAPAKDLDLVGRTIASKYRVDRFLAKGGMGRVFAGVRLEDEVPVAVKALTLDASDPLFRRRFFNEAALSASLSHPGVVRVLDYGVEDDGVCFIVMELLQGETLGALVKRERRLPVRRALEIIREACQALAEAHGEGFVHRDLKPTNLFMTEDPEGGEAKVKILDFGLAKRLETDSSITQTGSFLGSPTYMSPEQITGTDLTVATDIYNLGLLLFRMVVGRAPFVGDVASSVLVDHATKPPPAFADIAPDLPPMSHVEWVVKKCLEKRPSARFADVQDLTRAIDACLRLENGHVEELSMELRDGVLRIDSEVGRHDQVIPERTADRRMMWASVLAGVGVLTLLGAVIVLGIVLWLVSAG